MEKKEEKKGFERDGGGNLDCDGLAGQDFRACTEMKKKEILDDLPRDSSGVLVCENLSGEEKSVCQRQKASEAAKRSIGMKTESD